MNLYLIAKLLEAPENLENLHNVVQEYKKLVEDNDDFQNLNQILAEDNVEGINLTEKIDLYDAERYKDENYGQEFRVLVLKKRLAENDQIVIAYNGHKLGSEKVLPDEFTGLQIVYAQMAAKYPHAEITFTGCNGGADLAFINTLFSNQRREYQIKSGDTVIDEGKKLIGSDWQGKLKKKDGTAFTRDDNLIYSGEKMYYDPLEANKIKAALFYDQASNMKEFLSFSKHNLDADYQPWIQFAIKGVKGNLKNTAKGAVSLLLTSMLGRIFNNALRNNRLLTFIVLGYNSLSSLLACSYIPGSLLETILKVKSLSLATSAGNMLVVGSIAGLIFSSVVLGLLLGLKIWNNQQLQEYYQLLKELKLLSRDETKEGIKGYITDCFLKENKARLTTYQLQNYEKKAVKVDIEAKYGIYITDRNLQSKLDLSTAESTIFVRMIGERNNFLRFIKNEDNNVYQLKSIIKTNKNYATEFPQAKELKKAKENYKEYLAEVHPDIIDNQGVSDTVIFYEIDLEPLSEINKKIKQLKENSDLNKQEKKDLEQYFKIKKDDFKRVQEKLKEYELLGKTLRLFGEMQRVYQMQHEIFEIIFPIEKGIKIAKNISSVEQEDTRIDDLGTVNESIFMPYIKQGNKNSQAAGDLGKNIREDYIASMVKSMLQKYKEVKDEGYYKSMSYDRSISPSLLGSTSTAKNKNAISKVKYGVEDYKKEYKHDFEVELKNISGEKKKINQEFLKIINQVQCREIRNAAYAGSINKFDKTVFFNYYQRVMQQIENNPQLLEKCYQIKEVQGNKEYPNATHSITFNRDYKKKLEYKYNPCDEIIGGNLKLYVKEKENKEKIANTARKEQPKTQNNISEIQKEMLAEREKKIIAAQKTTPSPKFSKNKKIIISLNNKSSVDEIKEAAQIVISEAKRKKKPIIAEMLEDYLSGMYNQKRVDAKKLRGLDAVKTAEVELKLKIDKNLVWEINRRVFSKPNFKPGERLTFDLKESMLVNPYNSTIEEFLNPSKQSRLTVEASFVLEKMVDRDKLKLRGKMNYSWRNNYRWLAGRKKRIGDYGYIDDYLLKKLADEKVAKSYKVYSNWNYYLEDSISLLTSGVDYSKHWYWKDFLFLV
ncbi:hypothetical protein [Halanaerobacter jeridensis]|uniref:Uncharacterized protein n=1 Tax=Halanaerobacter jeridensis TaxID=706427 RepID=A0A939BPZ6_9FIRM|nr:hypothetical protein [Halanaerobacter jeridensis]MBM7557483.1 hypothetical protein [Halanaerobacter jeridensis]